MEIENCIHKFDTGPFNWYVIEEAGRLTVVDAGFPGHYRVFLSGLERIGRSIADVEAIVVTHAHADHMGFAEKLRRLTQAPIYVHAEDVAAIRHPYPLPWWGLVSHAHHPFMASMLTRALFSGLIMQPGISNPIAVKDGQTLDIPGRPVVMHAPGHTRGQIALYLPSRRILFSSDVLVTRDLVSGEPGPPQLAHPSLNADTREARRSLKRFKELGELVLLPGHGRPWRGDLRPSIAALVD